MIYKCFCVYLDSFQLTKQLNDENKLPEDPTETLHQSSFLPTGTTGNHKELQKLPKIYTDDPKHLQNVTEFQLKQEKQFL